VKRGALLALCIGLSVAAPVVGSAGCSSDDDEGRETAPAPDGATPDAGAVPEAAVEAGLACTVVDIPAGAGKKFCELPGTDAAELQVPPEFCVREFTTTPLAEARVLRFAPNGDLFVTAPSMVTSGGAVDGPGSIVVLPDDDRDGRADAIVTYAGPSPRNGNTTCAPLESDPKNMACVHGILFDGGYLYFTRSDEVRRVPYAAGDRAVPAVAGELVATLGGAAISDVRWTHTLERSKEGSLYVSRGRGDSSACTPEEMTRGAVFTLHIETSAALPLTPELLTDGFRNPMFLRCSPGSCGDCYAAELSGDNWDGVGGREKLALLGKGDKWGFPCCVGPGMAAPGWDSKNCGDVSSELVAIPLHDTPFGLDFDRGGFPEPYRHGLFVALHGVITSYGGTGVIWMKTDPTTLRPTGSPQMFVKGFGMGTGRATDAVFAPDGRLFIADDTAGKIYWVAPRTLAAPN
jgi:glucose/arabinose dehydrogenase